MQPSDEIKSKLDIVDLIREYVNLKPAGMNFRAPCPFHRERTPSFMVSPDKQIWHCFGCGKGGDIFSFIQEIEGVEFVEALRILAPKAGVTLRRQDPKLMSKRNRVLDILELSRKFYHKLLLSDQEAAPIRKYLKTRQLKEETIIDWQIGYAPDSWDRTGNFLRGKGFKDNELFQAGMVVKSDNSNRFYDRFRGRLVFPINDLSANTVAFSARVAPHKEKEEVMGKYINSPQTDVYDKSKILFGLDKAKIEIKNKDQAIIVEGQMDVITAHQAGYRNVVASSGTALTAEAIQSLKRYSPNLLLAFDQDKAGSMAANRGIREALKQEMSVNVIALPAGTDPDECIREKPEVWQSALMSAKSVMEHSFDYFLKDLDMDNVQHRRQAAAKLLPVVNLVKNKIEQDYWLKNLGERIGVEESILRETLRQIKPAAPSRQEAVPEIKPQATAAPLTRAERMSELMLVLIIRFPFLLTYTLNNLQVEEVRGEELNELYRNLISYYNNIINNNDKPDIQIDYQKFRNSLILKYQQENNRESNQLKLLDRLVFLGERDFFDTEKEKAKEEMINIVRELKRMALYRRMTEIERQLKDSEKSQNQRLAQELMEEFKILSDELIDLNK